MDEARTLAIRAGERAQHRVEMPAPLPRAALHREARRLVEHDDVGVLVDDEAAHEARVLVRDGRRARAGDGELLDVRRQAHDLSRVDARLAVGALAVEPDLALAQQLLDPPLGQAGDAATQPAIEALVGVLSPDFYQFDAAHLASREPGARRCRRAPGAA